CGKEKGKYSFSGSQDSERGTQHFHFLSGTGEKCRSFSHWRGTGLSGGPGDGEAVPETAGGMLGKKPCQSYTAVIRWESQNQLFIEKAEEGASENAVLFRPYGGHYRIHLPKCPPQIFSRNRQIFFTFSLPGDEEDYDPEGASGYPAGE